MSNDNKAHEIPISLETATNYARSNRDWDEVYQYIVLHPKDFFTIAPGRRWAIAHQMVFHGSVELFKRILAIFSDDQIDIRSRSGDGKTLLDIAIDKQVAHPLMYTYIEHLFAQDELIAEAKKNHWNSVIEILKNNKDLANEKPPYSPYFLLHYVVQNGDAHILQNLLQQFQFLPNVLNIKNETPLHMAMRLNKHDMCSILRSKTTAQPPVTQNQPLDRSDEQVTYHAPIKPSNEPPKYQPSISTSHHSSKPVASKTQSASIGFGGVESPLLFNSTFSPPPHLRPQTQSGFQHVYTRKTIVKDYPSNNWDPPPSPPPASTSSNDQLMENLTCTLTQEIFVDPVIANDGRTYERAAILDWVNVYHCSPTTNAPMDATFRDNIEIKRIIQSMRRQN